MSTPAAVSVRATVAGGKVGVTADVTKLPADASGLTLHVVLAEKGLMFGGENGVRGHRMVVPTDIARRRGAVDRRVGYIHNYPPERDRRLSARGFVECDPRSESRAALLAARRN